MESFYLKYIGSHDTMSIYLDNFLIGGALMQSITRAMTVAKVLANHPNDKGITISELSKECDLALGTIHRLLQSMAHEGLVEQDEETKKYRLGIRWLEYGLHVYESVDYVKKIRPEMEQLSREVEESIYFSKPLGTEAMVVERIDSENNPIRIHDRLGVRIAMNIGASNKAMLASMPIDQAEHILKELISPEEIPGMLEKLDTIRQQGYATSHAELTEGTASVAVSLKDSFGQIIGAISIDMLSYNLTEERLEFLTTKVIETGKRISQKIGASN